MGDRKMKHSCLHLPVVHLPVNQLPRNGRTDADRTTSEPSNLAQESGQRKGIYRKLGDMKMKHSCLHLPVNHLPVNQLPSTAWRQTNEEY